MSSTTRPDSSPHRIAMFADGYWAHHPLMIASSRVASRRPFGARRANGCFPERSQRAPFMQAHEPSGNGFHNGKTLHPYAAYLRAVDASADAAAGNGVTPSPVSLRQQAPSLLVYPSSAPPSLAPPSPPGG